MKIEIDINENLKQRIDSLTEKPIEEFCKEMIEQDVDIIENERRLDFA